MVLGEAVATGEFLNELISPEPHSLLVLDALLLVKAELFGHKVDVGFALCEFEDPMETWPGPCPHAEELLPATSLQRCSIFHEKIVVFGLSYVDNVAALACRGTERVFIGHPLVVIVQHPGDFIDQTVCLPSKLSEANIDCPRGGDVVEFYQLFVFFDIEVTVDETYAKSFFDKSFFDTMFFEDGSEDCVNEMLAISLLELVPCGRYVDCCMEDIPRVRNRKGSGRHCVE